MKEKFKAIGMQFLLILLYIFLSFVLTGIFFHFLTNNNVFIKTLSYITLDLIILTIYIIIFRKTIVPDFEDFKKNGKKYINDNIKYYLIGLIIMFITNSIISLFIGMPQNEEANRELLSNLPVASILSVLVFAPITEELLTRVALKDKFKHKIIYIFLSGFVFGLLHVIFSSQKIVELLFIIPYGALGCALAKIYDNSNNVWTNIFYHSFHNLICVLLLTL